jgi:hypothetical protein
MPLYLGKRLARHLFREELYHVFAMRHIQESEVESLILDAREPVSRFLQFAWLR